MSISQKTIFGHIGSTLLSFVCCGILTAHVAEGEERQPSQTSSVSTTRDDSHRESDDGAHILMSVQFFESSNPESIALLERQRAESGKLFGNIRRPIALSVVTISANEWEKLWPELARMKGTIVWSRPQLHCLAEQEVQAQTGRTFIIEGMTKSREDVEHRFVGISLVAKPRVIESNKVNCLLCVESSKVDEENGVQLNEQFIPGLQKRRLQTEMSINDGEVFIIGMSTSTGDDNQKWSFVSAVTRIQKSDSKDGFSKSATPPATNEIPHKSTSESKP